MADPMTYLWTELIAEFIRRTGQDGAVNPMKPEIKDLVSFARNLGLICNGTSVEYTDRDQVRQLLESIPLPPGMTIDLDDFKAAPAPPPLSKAATPPSGTPSTPPASSRTVARLRCSAIKADGVSQCKIEGADLDVDQDGNPFCCIQQHHDQGNWTKPAPSAPVVMTEAEIRAELQDIIDDRSGKSRDELRGLMNPLLRKLPGFDSERGSYHVNQLVEIRMKMLELKLDPAKFRWDDVKAPKPKVKAPVSPVTPPPGPGSAPPPPKKKPKPTKGAKKPKVKTPGSKPKPKKKAPPKTPPPSAHGKPKSTITKGSKMPSSADIQAAAQLRMQENADADSEAFSYFRTWQDQPNDALKRAVADTVPKKLKKRFEALVKKHEAEDGDDTGTSSKLAKAVAKLAEGKKGKKKLSNDSYDKLDDEGFDPEDVDKALKALNKKEG